MKTEILLSGNSGNTEKKRYGGEDGGSERWRKSESWIGNLEIACAKEMVEHEETRNHLQLRSREAYSRSP